MKTVVWLPGLFANATGEKVDSMRDMALASGAAFIPFNYPNWDKPEAFRVSAAIAAAKELVSQLRGEVVLVASSFGSWVAVKVAEAFPGKVVSIVAAAPRVDFVAPIYATLPLWKKLAVRVLGAPYRVGDRKHKLSWGFISDAMHADVAVWNNGTLNRLKKIPVEVLLPTQDRVWGWHLMRVFVDGLRAAGITCGSMNLNDDHSMGQSLDAWKAQLRPFLYR